MNSEKEPQQALATIRDLMDRGSRFVSLSGWSGVAAGVCALAAAGWASHILQIHAVRSQSFLALPAGFPGTGQEAVGRKLMALALGTFALAFLAALFFTWLRSRKTGLPLWGFVARRVLVHVAVPMLAGGFVIWRLADFGLYGLAVPACLIFYGLGLINASKFTLPEVRYLGYLQLLLGIICLWVTGYGLYFWAAGFGVLHILYGLVMWYRHERKEKGAAR